MAAKYKTTWFSRKSSCYYELLMISIVLRQFIAIIYNPNRSFYGWILWYVDSGCTFPLQIRSHLRNKIEMITKTKQLHQIQHNLKPLVHQFFVGLCYKTNFSIETSNFRCKLW